eukprot:TRINITY_DN10644_c0_g1_i1.p1 TRINITY_DN10644_c0_g1~~TRINITY_DN10644_c0_g1_i1.p1  ORF type:complete len:90 (+),score=24.85 TRINITY_DN10644_c0_g1_i1:109-378(+)
MADATGESEARRALRRYLMLKAVLIKPLRGGGGRWNRNTNMTDLWFYSINWRRRSLENLFKKEKSNRTSDSSVDTTAGRSPETAKAHRG